MVSGPLPPSMQPINPVTPPVSLPPVTSTTPSPPVTSQNTPPQPPPSQGMENAAMTGTNGTDRVQISNAALQASNQNGGTNNSNFQMNSTHNASNPSASPARPSGNTPVQVAQNENQTPAGYGSATAPRSPIADLAPGRMLNVIG